MDARTFTPEEKKTAVDIVCERISAGESLRSILHTGRESHLPAPVNFLRWLTENDSWDKQYVRACQVRADLMFDELLEIADSEPPDILRVQDNKLKIDTRKWILSRMNPKKYGDKNTVEISNPALDEVRAQFPNFKAGERVSKE
jgi:hypothetical protein